MSFVLNTDAVDEADRAEFVHEALAATMVPIELHWLPKATGAAARGVITNLGDLTICSGRTSALRWSAPQRWLATHWSPASSSTCK